MKRMAEEELRAPRPRSSSCSLHTAGATRACYPKTKRTKRTQFWKCAPVRAGKRRRCSRAQLFRMYQRYAEHAAAGSFEVLSDFSETGLGGMKEATATITGRGVFAKLKFESGVHRVQRVPVTEGGRPRAYLRRHGGRAAGSRRSRYRRSTTRTCASTCSAPPARAASR